MARCGCGMEWGPLPEGITSQHCMNCGDTVSEYGPVSRAGGLYWSLWVCPYCGDTIRHTDQTSIPNGRHEHEGIMYQYVEVKIP